MASEQEDKAAVTPFPELVAWGAAAGGIFALALIAASLVGYPRSVTANVLALIVLAGVCISVAVAGTAFNPPLLPGDWIFGGLIGVAAALLVAGWLRSLLSPHPFYAELLVGVLVGSAFIVPSAILVLVWIIGAAPGGAATGFLAGAAAVTAMKRIDNRGVGALVGVGAGTLVGAILLVPLSLLFFHALSLLHTLVYQNASN